MKARLRFEICRQPLDARDRIRVAAIRHNHADFREAIEEDGKFHSSSHPEPLSKSHGLAKLAHIFSQMLGKLRQRKSVFQSHLNIQRRHNVKKAGSLTNSWEKHLSSLPFSLYQLRHPYLPVPEILSLPPPFLFLKVLLSLDPFYCSETLSLPPTSPLQKFYHPPPIFSS
jgi:hypothetical protein